MTYTTDALQKVEITVEEKRALTALLRGGMTHGVLGRLGLSGLMERLTVCHRVMWEADAHHKDNAPTLGDYGISEIHSNKIS